MTESNDAAGQVLAPEQQELQQQFNYHAAMAFGEQPPSLPTEQSQGQPTLPADTPPADSSPTVQEDVFDESDYLKNNFGWDTKDAALSELQQLRQLKENATTQAEIKYANEESKRIHQLLQSGTKEDRIKLRQELEKQERLDAYTTGDITKDNAPDIIKLGMQLRNERLTKEEIEFQYKQEFVAPKEPVQRLSEDETEFAERHDEWKEKVANIEMKKVVAAKMAIPELEKLKATIELPNINLPQQNNIDKDYEDYKASNAKSIEDYNNVIVPAINSLKEQDLAMSIKVDDPNNQMQFEVSIAPDVNDFGAVKKDSLDVLGWLTKIAYDERGNFNAAKLNRAILLEKNFDKYAQSIARQAVNAERKRVVSKESKGGGVVRDFSVNPQLMTELDKEAQRAFAV